MDDELLSDAEACLNLEAYLSTGLYFNGHPAEPVAHNEVQVLEPTLEQLLLPAAPDSSSLVLRTFDPIDEVQDTQSSIAQSSIEVTDREPLIDGPDYDAPADWTFEDAITMAVLDAMDQRSKSPPKSPPQQDIELGVLGSPDLARSAELAPSPSHPRLRQARSSIRRTFESFRRRIRPA